MFRIEFSEILKETINFFVYGIFFFFLWKTFPYQNLHHFSSDIHPFSIYHIVSIHLNILKFSILDCISKKYKFIELINIFSKTGNEVYWKYAWK